MSDSHIIATHVVKLDIMPPTVNKYLMRNQGWQKTYRENLEIGSERM